MGQCREMVAWILEDEVRVTCNDQGDGPAESVWGNTSLLFSIWNTIQTNHVIYSWYRMHCTGFILLGTNTLERLSEDMRINSFPGSRTMANITRDTFQYWLKQWVAHSLLVQSMECYYMYMVYSYESSQGKLFLDLHTWILNIPWLNTYSKARNVGMRIVSKSGGSMF